MLVVYQQEINARDIIICAIVNRITLIDRFEIVVPCYQIKFGWVDVRICELLIYRGPYRWFAAGSLDFVVDVGQAVKIHCTIHDCIDMPITEIQLMVYGVHGEQIPVKYTIPAREEPVR